jgi:hypothetical protein
MFVVDPDADQALRGKSYVSLARGVEVVDLVTGNNFVLQ